MPRHCAVVKTPNCFKEPWHNQHGKPNVGSSDHDVTGVNCDQAPPSGRAMSAQCGGNCQHCPQTDVFKHGGSEDQACKASVKNSEVLKNAGDHRDGCHRCR